MNEWEWQLLEDKPALDQVTIDGVAFKIGDHVRLRPRKGGSGSSRASNRITRARFS